MVCVAISMLHVIDAIEDETSLRLLVRLTWKVNLKGGRGMKRMAEADRTEEEKEYNKHEQGQGRK